METQVAAIAIIVRNKDAVDKLNALLHEYADYIIGRMGVPYRQKEINIITVALDAEPAIIANLQERIEGLEGISAQAVYSK